MSESHFEWDELNDYDNQQKHGISFHEAQFAFLDKNRVIAEDTEHSMSECRYYCIGLNQNKSGILTVRFTYRNDSIRIIGAAYWRKGKKIYEQTNKI